MYGISGKTSIPSIALSTHFIKRSTSVQSRRSASDFCSLSFQSTSRLALMLLPAKSGVRAWAHTSSTPICHFRAMILTIFEAAWPSRLKVSSNPPGPLKRAAVDGHPQPLFKLLRVKQSGLFCEVDRASDQRQVLLVADESCPEVLKGGERANGLFLFKSAKHTRQQASVAESRMASASDTCRYD